MKKYRFKTRFRILIPILLVVVAICSVMCHDHKSEIICFAVDSLDRLYIGFDDVITVHEGEERIRSIDTSAFRSYYFTIQEDDTILLADSTKGYTMDLDGNVLDSWDDLSAEVYNNLKVNRKAFTSSNGDTYELRWASLWPRIVRNGETVVYQTDSLVAAANLVKAVAWGLVWIFAMWELWDAVNKNGYF